MIQLYIHIYTFFFRFFPFIVHLFNCSTLIRCVVVLHCGTNLHFPNRQCGEGSGTPFQYSCLENPMDRGAWWAAVHGVTKSQTRLGDFTFTFNALEKEMATHSSVLAWRVPGTGEPRGLPSMGSHRAGHDWSDLAAAATGNEGLPRWPSGKESACQCKRHKRCWFDPWVGKIAWRRKWQPTPVLLPGKSQGQRSLAATVQGVTQSWTRQRTHTHTQAAMLDVFSWAYLPFAFILCVCEVSAFIFCPFKKLGCLFSYCWEFKYSYILDTSVLSDMWHANIVSPLVVCYFISYKVSLTEETILILLKSNHSILSFMDYAFGVTSKCNWTCKWLMATPSFSCQGWPCHPVLANRTHSCKRSFNVSCYGCSAPSLASSIYLLGVRLWYSCHVPGIGYILGLHSGKLKTMHLKNTYFCLCRV